MFLAVFATSLQEETLEDGSTEQCLNTISACPKGSSFTISKKMDYLKLRIKS
jgi:hypothetical protein